MMVASTWVSDAAVLLTDAAPGVLNSAYTSVYVLVKRNVATHLNWCSKNVFVLINVL